MTVTVPGQTIRLLLVAACLLQVACSSVQSSTAPTSVIGKVSMSTGFPSVLRNSRPYILAEQSAVFTGDILITDEQSLVNFTLGDGISIKLGTHSRLMVSEYTPSGDSARIILSLSTGSMEIEAPRSGDRYEITTTMADIRTRAHHFWLGYDSTGRELEVVTLSSQPVRVKNRDGSVELASPLEASSVTAGTAPQKSPRWTRPKFEETKNARRLIRRL